MLRVSLVEVFEAELAPVWPVRFCEVPDLPFIHPRDQLRHVTRPVYAVEAWPVMRVVVVVVLRVMMTMTVTCPLTAAPLGPLHPVTSLPEPCPPRGAP